MSTDSENDKRYLHQMKYILYGVMGGFYFSSRYQPWIKYLWFFVNFIVVMITQFLGTIGYFIVSPAPKPIRDIFYAVLTSNVAILSVFAIPCLTYYFKSRIEQVLTLTEEEFFANARADSTEIRSARSNVNRMIILHTSSIGVFVLIHPLFQFFSGDADSLNNLDYNLFPHIWLGSVQTSLQYYVIFTIQFVAAALLVISFVTFSIYVYFIGHEFCVASSGLRNFLNDFSTPVGRNLENASNDETLGETAQKTSLVNDEFEDYETTFEVNHQGQLSSLIVAIRAHQVLYKKLKIIKPHIEFLFSSVLMILVGDQCFFIYMMCSTDLDNFLKTKEIVGVWCINLILFTYCQVGKLLDDAAYMISTQLSDIPWYYLSSQQRRTYYIFLCQTHRTMRFEAFGVYAMNMPIMLQNLRIIFSLYNILRQVLNK